MLPQMTTQTTRAASTAARDTVVNTKCGSRVATVCWKWVKGPGEAAAGAKGVNEELPSVHCK